jgi:hypothetical protein
MTNPYIDATWEVCNLECPHILYTPGYVQGDCPACDHRAIMDLWVQWETWRQKKRIDGLRCAPPILR